MFPIQITKELGQEIIKRISEYIEIDINIMDLAGKIVASTDQSRIDQMHSGAMKVIENEEKVILYEDDIQDYPGTKPGVNLPILHKGKIKGVVGVSGNPADIRKVTGIIRVSVEVVLDQIYIQRQAFFKEQQWNQWLHQLLHPLGFDREQLEEEATYSLNMNPKQSFKVLVFTGEEIHNHLETIRKEIHGAKINSTFILPFLEREIVVSLDPTFKRIHQLVEKCNELIGKKMRVGIGNVEFGIDGIRNSYLQAKQALAFANTDAQLSDIANWKVERLIAAISRNEYDSICKNYEALLDNLGEEYIRTIAVYLTLNFSNKETAKYLHIHRNTLQYRLDQIKDKVNLDPRVFHDAFILKIILMRK